MRKPPDSNPYRDASFDELAQACSEASRILQDRPFTTRTEKEAFAARLRFLLLAIAMRFRVGDSIPGTPEMELSRSLAPDVEASYMEWYAKTLRRESARVRVMTLYQAANFALGRDGAYWVLPGCPVAGKSRPIDRAEHSDDGLRFCLRDLAALCAARNQ